MVLSFVKKKSTVSPAAEAQNVLVLMRFRRLMKYRRMAKQQVRKVQRLKEQLSRLNIIPQQMAL